MVATVEEVCFEVIVHFIYVKRSFSSTLQYFYGSVNQYSKPWFCGISVSENESGLSNPSRFANYSKLSSQQFFSLRCRHFVSIDLKTYLLDCGSQCRPRKQRAWQPITWPNMFPIYRAIIFSYRAIIFHLSRDILILSRDKKDVACPLWATVINCYNLLVSR